MIAGLFDNTSIPLLEQVASFSQARHAVLAGNIANLDTPGYRVRDLSPELFRDRLREAIAARDRSLPGDEPAFDTGSARPLDRVASNLQGILRHDDVNVSLEQQVTEIAKNQGQHNLALAVLTSQFRLLGAAISERA
jgi:flagellar basal-body rod protein FlgB